MLRSESLQQLHMEYGSTRCKAAVARQAYNERPNRFQSQFPPLLGLAPTSTAALPPTTPVVAPAPAALVSAAPTVAQANCSYQQPTVEDEQQWTQVRN